MRLWIRRNFPLFVVVTCVLFGVMVVHALAPPFFRSSMTKFPTMVWVGTAFGLVGFKLEIAAERMVKHKLK